MRYSRQVRFAPFGAEAQARLERGSALIVGVGALGTHTAEALARAGVGRLILVDRDIVEASNLQRQGLYTEADADAGVPKASAAAVHLRAIRSDLDIVALAEDFTPDLWSVLGARPDVILDGTDNYPTRYTINDLALRDRIPWIYGGAVGAGGSAAVVLPGVTPCLRCWLPEPPVGAVATCETEGVLGPAVAMVAAFQTVEALKILGGRASAVSRGTLQVDVWTGHFAMRGVARAPRGDCPTCGRGEFPALAAGAAALPTAVLCGRDAVQVRPRPGHHVDLDALVARLRPAGVAELAVSIGSEGVPGMVRFAVEGVKFSVFAGGRALVFGTDQTGRAQALYDRYIGSDPAPAGGVR